MSGPRALTRYDTSLNAPRSSSKNPLRCPVQDIVLNNDSMSQDGTIVAASGNTAAAIGLGRSKERLPPGVQRRRTRPQWGPGR